MQIDIPPNIAQRLQQLASEQGASVGELLERLLDRYDPAVPPGSLASLAQNAREADMMSPEPVNTAERSREILENEYGASLAARLNAHDDSNG